MTGSNEAQGDLKSVVLHSLEMTSVASTFEVPIGVRLTGVDAATYSLTGEAFSDIVPPKHVSTSTKVLQSDDVALAYEFARKFPGVSHFSHSNSSNLLLGLTECMCVC